MKAFALALLFALPLSVAPARAQTPPPIQGVTGTIATDETTEAEHKAAGPIARRVAQAAGAAKKLFSFGGNAAGRNPLDALTEGRRVVVQDSASAPASAVEAVVVDVNRRRQQITVRFADKKTQTLRVLDRSAADQGSHVVVSLADQPGEKIAYDFTRVS